MLARLGASSQYELAFCIANGLGVEKDAGPAIEWNQRAADAGMLSAQHNLGRCYEFGEGVTKDAQAAVGWYRRAAEAGFPLAQCRLGSCYENGFGVEADEREAIEWYSRAASADGENDPWGASEARVALARLGARPPRPHPPPRARDWCARCSPVRPLFA